MSTQLQIGNQDVSSQVEDIQQEMIASASSGSSQGQLLVKFNSSSSQYQQQLQQLQQGQSVPISWQVGSQSYSGQATLDNFNTSNHSATFKVQNVQQES